MQRGQRFGNWEVISIDYEQDKRYNKYYLCYDIIYNELRYVRRDYLLNGKSKGAQNPGNKGWSTKSKNKHLGKYVSYFPIGNKPYRVVRKVKGTNTVITLGYFNKLKEAKELAQKS